MLDCWSNKKEKAIKLEVKTKKCLENNSMQDFYETTKLEKVAELAEFIKEKIRNESWNINYKFCNKKGLLDIFKEFHSPDFKLGIQIEGNQLRYYMSILYGDSSKRACEVRETIAVNIAYDGYWFKKTMNPKNPHIYKIFCGYKPDFIYRYALIDKHFGWYDLDKVSYQDIAKQVKKDVVSADKNINKIKKVILRVLEEERW